MTVNDTMIVAFGATDDAYVVVSGTRDSKSNIPDGLTTAIVTKASAPIKFVALGPGTTKSWFVIGRKPGSTNYVNCYYDVHALNSLSQALRIAVNTGGDAYPRGIGLWSNNAYAWWTTNKVCHYSNLGELRLGWVNKCKLESPSKKIHKVFLGAGNAIVLVWGDGTSAYSGLDHKLANVLSTANTNGLRIRVREPAIDAE